MDALTIDILAALDPSGKIKKPPVSGHGQVAQASPLYVESVEQFLSRYGRPNFGYYIARQFALSGMPFPIAVYKRDYWVFRAYLMLLDPWLNYDRHIADALHICNPPSGAPDLNKTLKAMLLTANKFTSESKIAEVALKTGLPKDTIEAYESLFYNILDRQDDLLYIAHLVYPNTRIVEFADDYFQSTPLGDLLKRAGYNHKDMDLTSYLAGIGDRDYMARLSAADNREAELSKNIMGNGLILSRANLLNQRSIGMSRASTLLAASRQSGQQTEEPALALCSDYFSAALMDAVNVSREMTVEMLREDAGSMVAEAEVLSF
jgi:hypothetical protein